MQFVNREKDTLLETTAAPATALLTPLDTAVKPAERPVTVLDTAVRPSEVLYCAFETRAMEGKGSCNGRRDMFCVPDIK